MSGTVLLMVTCALGAAVVALFLARRSLIRELRETRRALDRAQEELDASGKIAAIGQLSAGVAHELNTPIGAALSILQTVLTRPLPEQKVKERLRVAEDALVRCKEIVGNLLVYTRRPETAEGVTFTRFIRAPLDVGAVIRGSLTLIESQRPGGDVHVSLHLEETPMITGNANQLTQVFNNLFSNAYDAVLSVEGKERRIEVRARAQAGSVIVEIADNGPGIPEEHVDRIFDPFFTTKDVGKGTGLGLSICAEIMKRHGGDIRAESGEGGGTTFRLTFPGGPGQR
jgi:signal transduction histidine kinase